MLQRTIAHVICSSDEDPAKAGWAHRGLKPAKPLAGGRNPETQLRCAMEASVNVNAKGKTKPDSAKFDTKFEMPKFELPKMEVPAAFREITEKSVSQAKENYEKLKAAAEEATEVMEETYATATKGSTEYGLKLIDAARLNTNAAFDFFGELIAVKSLSEALELSTAHARKQFETVTEQTKELTSIAQKVATDAAEPLKSGVTKAFAKVG
jgi:phasin